MKKKMYTYVFGYFSNSMCEKKKCIYVFFFGHFPVARNKGKKKIKKKTKKKEVQKIDFGYCPIV